MHPEIFQQFERICFKQSITGAVLEVGATPNESSLLRLPSLADAREKVGINLKGPYECDGYRILKGNANNMDCFEDGYFDAVLCNAMLEHDPYFWKTLDEIKRVTKPGGLIIIGVPGFRSYRTEERIKRILKKTPLLKRLVTHRYFNALFTGTMTFQVHAFPGDYYRFSPEAVKEVFFGDMDKVFVSSVMLPPRLIGRGRKRAAGNGAG